MGKINFEIFTKQVIDAKGTAEEEPYMPLYKKMLYDNYRYWGMCAINDWIRDTPLDTGDRQDKSLWSEVTEEKGIILIDWVESCIKGNAEHHNLLQEVSTETGTIIQEIIECNEEVMDKAIEELFDEYDFSIVGAYEGW
tara:strand:- start:1771 stop:2187 length:417 start_codon:yes stop_codon:yes gene_type:complete